MIKRAMTRMFLMLATFCSLAPGAKPSQLDALVKKVQATWDATKSFQASFHQTVYSKALQSVTEEASGKLYVSRPNRLRWEAETDKTVQILNGNEFKVIQTNERRKSTTVEVYKNVQKFLGARSLNFLAGKLKFTQSYKIELIEENDQSAKLKLIPKAKGKEGDDTYIAEVDKKDYFLTSLTTDSSDTRVELRLSAIERNVALKKQLFTYQPGPTDYVHVNN